MFSFTQLSALRGRCGVLTSLTLLSLSLLGRGASAQQVATSTGGQLSASANARFSAQFRALQDEKAALTPAQRKLATALVLSLPAKKLRLSRNVTSFRGYAAADAGGRSDVIISGRVTPSLLSAIARVNGEILCIVPDENAVRALLSPQGAESVATLPEVRFIRLYVPPIAHAGPVTSEGDAAHRADTTRALFKIAGRGIRVGVLSDGIGGLTTSQNKGELGNVTIIKNAAGQAQKGSGSEGTAMLEIVHDLAPSASLYFATGEGGQEVFADNIRRLKKAGCNIIVDDLLYLDEGVYQDDAVAQAVTDVVNGGALYFSAAGNEGNLTSKYSGTWEGQFRDGGAYQTSKGAARIHLWGNSPTNAVTQADSGASEVVLHWADPLDASTNDYDLYVLDADGNIISTSQDVQDGTGRPFETAYCYSGTRIVATLSAGVGRPLHVEMFTGRLSITTASAIYGHAASSKAIGVAAVPAQSAGVPYVPFTAANRVEDFSSDGFRTYYFDPTGNKKTFSVRAPQLAAADGVKTSVSGFSPFYGTSAAAPHAAAIAALVWSYDLKQTAADVRSVLSASTLDIMDKSYDRDSGFGLLMADLALARIGPPVLSIVPSVSLTEGNSGEKSMKFTISLSKKGTQDVTVKYTARSGAARVNSDFTATSGTLTIAAGQTKGYVLVPILGDTAYEGDETFTLSLSQSSTPVSGDAFSTGTIKNDDANPAPQSNSNASAPSNATS